MNELKVFEKVEFGTVRVVEQNGEPWFVAKDVLAALGYASDYNPSRATQNIPEEWKGVQPIHTPGGTQEMLVISEQGLYFFLGRSDKPKALPYQKWIAGEVVPSIRKTGQYGGYSLPRIPQSFPDALRMIADIEEEKALAIEQRDYYKRTKAQIGSKREATAMATASAAVRKINALEDELGRGKLFKAVKAIPWLLEEFEPSKGMYSVVGKALKKLSAELGYPVAKIIVPEFPDGINAYHVDVIAAFRKGAINAASLYRYRKHKVA
jgi:prophage antirepressor-like protein